MSAHVFCTFLLKFGMDAIRSVRQYFSILSSTIFYECLIICVDLTQDKTGPPHKDQSSLHLSDGSSEQAS